MTWKRLLLLPHVSHAFWRIQSALSIDQEHVFKSFVLFFLSETEDLNPENFLWLDHKSQRNHIENSVYKSVVKENRTERKKNLKILKVSSPISYFFLIHDIIS